MGDQGADGVTPEFLAGLLVIAGFLLLGAVVVWWFAAWASEQLGAFWDWLEKDEPPTVRRAKP